MANIAVPTSDDADSEPFGRLATILYAKNNEIEIYRSICEIAPHLVLGCDHASLMVDRGKGFVTLAASDEVASQVDRIKVDVGDGPCFDPSIDVVTQIDSDIAVATQWPELSKRVVAETPVRGMIGFRIVVEEKKVGALSLYSDTAGAFTDASHNQGAVLKSFATVTLLAHWSQAQADSMLNGLKSNREIGKAVGLLMAFHQISDVEAFEMLAKTSQDMNIRVAEVARQLVDYHNEDEEASSSEHV